MYSYGPAVPKVVGKCDMSDCYSMHALDIYHDKHVIPVVRMQLSTYMLIYVRTIYVRT